MMNSKNIEEKQKQIDEQITSTHENCTFDGIVNVEEYLKSPIKILWILKEVNDEDGYNQRDAFNELVQTVSDTKSLSNTNRKAWWPTLDPIIYVSFQILNNFTTWQKVNYIQDEPLMVSVLRKIAYINLKKEPGGAVSEDYRISEGYEKAKEILKTQIDLIKPDVIIGGNTIKYLKDDYNLTSFKKVEGYNLEYTSTKDCLFIDSYHPQYLSRQNEDFKGDYINEIVTIVKNWKDSK